MNVAKELATLEQMTVTALRRKYEEVFDEPCRSNHRQWLIKRIAWRLQCNAEGLCLSERARRRAEELANDADLRLKAPPPKPQSEPAGRTVSGAITGTHDSRLPMPGAVITRRYKGRTLRVTVLDEGFEFAGETYKSLSAVAKTITKTHTNGYLFFGLTKTEGQP